MNIELHTRRKQNDIQEMNAEAINENFDQVGKDLLDMSNALEDYLIDLTTDVTGELPAANIDTDELETALGLDQLAFAARHDSKRWCARQCTTTTKVEVGIGASTDTGDAGAAPDATTAWNTYTCAAASGSKAGFDMNSFARIGHNPTVYMYLKTGSSLANLRFWFGLSSAGQTNVDTHAAHCASFRYSTVVPDSGFIGVTRDGTTQSVTSSIHAIATSNIYRLSIAVVGSTVTFGILDLTAGETTESTASLSANLPGSTQNLLVSMQVFTTENVAKTWQFSRVYYEAN